MFIKKIVTKKALPVKVTLVTCLILTKVKSWLILATIKVLIKLKN